MTTHWRARIAATTTLFCLLCLSANAQKSPTGGCTDTTENDTGKTKDNTGVLCIGHEGVKSLEPTHKESFLRAFQFVYQGAEQPAFVFATAEGGQTGVVPNPNRFLNQFTLQFKFSELFPNASNLTSIVAALYDSDEGNRGVAINNNQNSQSTQQKKTLRLSNELCRGKGRGKITECLASGDGGWKRFFSGVSGSASMSQRSKVEQGFVVADLPFSKDWGPAYAFDFSPASLFITGSRWKAAIDSLKAVKVASADFGDDDELGCFANDPKVKIAVDQCVKWFAGPRRRIGKLGAVIIPTFHFQATSQFDYIKNGGVLAPEPGLQKTLKNYMLTWDLTRLIPSTADRAAVLEAYRGYPLPNTSPQVWKVAVPQPKLCITISGSSSRGYVPVGDDFTAARCRKVAMDADAVRFALACADGSDIAVGDPNHVQPLDENLNLPKLNACNWKAS